MRFHVHPHSALGMTMKYKNEPIHHHPNHDAGIEAKTCLKAERGTSPFSFKRQVLHFRPESLTYIRSLPRGTIHFSFPLNGKASVKGRRMEAGIK